MVMFKWQWKEYLMDEFKDLKEKNMRVRDKKIRIISVVFKFIHKELKEH
jgi:hypothetical protein